MPLPSRCAPLLLLIAGLAPLAAQTPDTAVTIPELVVVRAPIAAGAVGLSVTVLDRAAMTRGNPLPSLADVLGFVPGVTARDRGDRSLDQALAIRGAGARANFGVRGVRVLVDGIPATLPDGQTALTSLDLELADRIEVVRGPLAALHGNGSQGVVSIHTPAALLGPLHGRVGVGAGSEGTLDSWLVAGGGSARLGGLLAATARLGDGFRDHAAAEQWRVRGSVGWRPGPGSLATLRVDHADDPSLESPGALTLDEWRSDPRAAAPNSLLRHAGKTLAEDQVAIGWESVGDRWRAELHGWLRGRHLDNPIAAPAPSPAQPGDGVWIGLDRAVAGVRGSINRILGPGTLVTVGLDLQRQRDDRINRRQAAGIPFGDPYLDQQERVGELGLFSQVAVPIARKVTLRTGARHDRIAFAVDDHLDAAKGGERTMAAWSGDAALSLTSGHRDLWAGVATAFETPTTTELANQSDGGTGLNRQLDPARTRSIEMGARFHRSGVAMEAVAFRAVTDRTIAPVSEEGGRSFYANVGTTSRHGLEFGATIALTGTMVLRGSGTWIDARFGQGAVDANGASVEGNRLPGIAPFTARLGVSAAHDRWQVDAEQRWSSAIASDDANHLEVPGWGAGITDLTLQWQVAEPLLFHLLVTNLFDRDHVASVVVNGGFGRVVQPGAGRALRIGGEWRLAGGVRRSASHRSSDGSQAPP